MTSRSRNNLVTAGLLLLLAVPIWLTSHMATNPADSVVLVRTTQGWGTGWVIAPGRIVTAGHVAESVPLTVKTRDGRILLITSFHIYDGDSAVLVVDGDTPPPLPVSTRPLAVGDEVSSYGASFSPDMFQIFAKGYVMRSDFPFLNHRQGYVTSLGVGPGMSGAPLLHDGQVVGMVLATTYGYGVAVPVTEYGQWLPQE